MSDNTLVVAAPLKNAIAKIEGVLTQAGPDLVNSAKGLEQAMQVAMGMQALHNAMSDEVMKVVMQFQSQEMGFLTDKDTSGGYDVKTVRDVMITAMMKYGARLIGNEVNIIAGKCYPTKNFYIRALREFPGLTNEKIVFGGMSKGDGLAYVACVYHCKINGSDFTYECVNTKTPDNPNGIDGRIIVQFNETERVSNYKPDFIYGKAEKKLRQRVYASLKGWVFDESEDLPSPATIVVGETKTQSVMEAAKFVSGPVPSGMEQFESDLASCGDITELKVLFDMWKNNEEATEEQKAHVKARCTARKAELATGGSGPEGHAG